MTTATVYHQTNREHMFLEIESDEVRMMDYQRVARVTIPDNVANPLDFVFEKTNSIHHFWGENECVRLIGDKHRSTSAGDIIMLDGVKYMVATIGFKPL